MKKFILLTLVITTSTLAFCIKPIKYEVLIPAKKTIPKDVKTILFLARNIHLDTDSLTQYYSYNGKTLLDTTNYNRIIAESVYDGFASKTQPTYPTDTIRMVLLPQSTKQSLKDISHLEWNDVDAMCKSHNADILVSLDYITILNNYKSWYEDSWVGIADIKSFYKWTIYDPMNQKILLEDAKLDTIQSEERSNSLDYLLHLKMPRRNEIMNIVSYNIGEEMARTIIPHWKKIYREYYNGGNKTMKKANRWITQGKWEKAIALYKNVTKKDKYKARSQYNIAILYERLGQPTNAIFHLKKSIDIYHKMGKLHHELKRATNYLSVLEKSYSVK